MELDLLQQLSTRIADLGAKGARSVVRVDAGRSAPGSGVVWSADGAIIAAHHAVERDEDVEVALESGEVVRADVVGRDPTTDLAVLRAAASGLEPAEWGEEAAIRPGQLVIAISRPGRSARVVLASVARAGGEYRTPAGGRVERYVETTVAPRPGLSGSLLLGPDGRGVGIASAAISRGAAVAIPPSTLRRVVRGLLAHGEVRRGYLGLATIPVPLPPELRAATGEHVALLVSHVDRDGPAARAGILFGDGLLSFGGATLQDPSELLTLLTEDRIGDTVPMKVLRAGEVRDVAVTIGARPRGGHR